jgi:hypothetical protein
MLYQLREACPPAYRDALESIIQRERNDPDFEATAWKIESSLYTEEQGFLSFLERMRPGLFHFTTEENWKLIKTSRFIMPSGGERNGSFPYDRQNPHLAAKKKAVALFDFLELPREKCLLLANGWRTCFLSLGERNTGRGVWLTLDRGKLSQVPEKVIPTEHNLGSLWLFYLEAFYPEPIPIDCVSSAEQIRVANSGEIFIGPALS